MGVKKAIMIMVLCCLPCIQSVLHQLNSNDFLCPYNEVELLCSQQSIGLINWELSNSLRSVIITLSSPGEVANEMLGTSAVTANFTRNGSHYDSYLNIVIGNLQELVVKCEGQIINVTFFNYDILTSSQLTLTHVVPDIFIATWPQLPLDLSQQYTLTITSTSQSAISISTWNSSAIIQLRNSTRYNITLDSNICTGYASSFIVGECVFLENFPIRNDVRYVLQQNHGVEVNIECGGKTLQLVCTDNGEWTTAANNTQFNEYELHDCLTTTERIVPSMDSTADVSTTIEKNIPIQEGSLGCMTIVASISTLAIFLVVIGGIITFILGMLFGQKFKNRPTVISNERIFGPIYEEVSHHPKTAMTISVNAAYGEAGELRNNGTYEN